MNLAPDVAVARATAMLASAKAKAVNSTRVLAYIVLHYGVHTARRVAEVLAQLACRALLKLQLASWCLQRPHGFQQQVGTFSPLMWNNVY